MLDLNQFGAKAGELGLGTPDILILIVLLLILLVLIEKLFSALKQIAHRFLGFVIVFLALVAFILKSEQQIFVEMNVWYIGLLVVGTLVSLILLFNALMSMFKKEEETENIEQVAEIPDKQMEIKEPVAEEAAVITKTGTVEWRDFKNTIQDKSFLTVLSYAVVAQFGVFSGVTVTPPSAETGFIFFVIFVVAGFIFIRSSYANYGKGISHLVLGVIANLIISVILGHFWINLPYSMLFSFDYFKSNSLVAALSGTAVGLFMSSKK